MEKLVEIMLNEGLNDETIVNVLKVLVNEDAGEVDKKASLLAKVTKELNDGKATGTRKAALEQVKSMLTKKEEKKPATVSESCFNDIISIVEKYVVSIHHNKTGNSHFLAKSPEEAQKFIKKLKLDYKNGDSYYIHGGHNTTGIEGLHSYGGDKGYWGREASGDTLTKGAKFDKPSSQEYKNKVASYRKDI